MTITEEELSRFHAEDRIFSVFEAKRRSRVLDTYSDTLAREASSATDQIPSVSKSHEAETFLRASIGRNLILSHLSETQIELIVQALSLEKIAAKTTLYRAGDVGDRFYIVENGAFTFSIGEKVVNEAKGGDSFGELSLLYDCPHESTCLSPSKPAEVWVIDRRSFRKILELEREKQSDTIHDFLSSTPLLSGFAADQLSRLSNLAELFKFKTGEVIIHKGDVGSIFYFIKSGSVEVTNIGSENLDAIDITFGPGEYFGERALLLDEPRAATVRALEDVECLTLDRLGFHTYLGILKPKLDEKLGLRILNTLPLISNLDTAEKEKLFESFEVETFSVKEKILNQGETSNKFYIIKRGKVQLLKNMPGMEATLPVKVDVLLPGQYFGETSMISETAPSVDAVAIEDVECFTLGKDSFDDLLSSLKDFLARVRDNRIRKENYEMSLIAVESTPFLLSDLESLDIVGAGRFGTVRVVKHKILNTCYALKAVPKNWVVKCRQQKNLQSEKKILEMCNHPFIMKLYKTFRDDKHVYFLTEFIQGGELFSLLYSNDRKGFTMSDYCFYSACALEALSYLHEKSIIYRDLKPENLMIDHNGYLKMVDFGTAKVVQSKTYSMLGTPEYMAPEIILHKGYNKSVDYWALGILTYEMAYDRSPFASKLKGQKYVLKNILEGKLAFPKNAPEDIQSFVSSLLKSKPRQRLGMGNGGINEVREHPWFGDIDWVKLRNCKLPVPWVPDIRGPADVGYFLVYNEEDVPPVKPYKRKKGAKWDLDF